jgi:peptidoglycan/LPS O-acetylase OafA/YrhL
MSLGAGTRSADGGAATGTGDTSRGHDTAAAVIAAVTDAPAPEARLAYLPGLDGLRAVALAGVLAFHHGFGWARGGFLGVSSFFTLSGFLIGSLALAEWAGAGRLSVRGFWERRARRLLPAALVALAAVAALQATLGVGSAPTFRGDLLASLGYVANWRLLASTGDYARLFADPSPLAHMWSLAIEEQFYVVFPLLFPAVMLLAARRRRRPRPGVAGLTFAVLAGASFAAAWVLAGEGDSSGLVYYATYTRAGELLAGVVLACGVAVARSKGRGGAGGATASRGPALAAQLGGVGGVAGVAGIVGLAFLWHGASLGSARLFQGFTVLNAALTSLVILAALARGRVASMLGWRPLRQMGRISYGAYLYHWPIFLVLDAERSRVGHPWRLFAVRVAVTLVVATASYMLIEAPVRFGRRVPRPRLALLLGTGAASVVALVAVLPVREPEQAGLGQGAAEMGWTVEATGPDPTHVLLLGDSLAWSVGPAFRTWNAEHPTDEVSVAAYTPFGCPAGGFEVPLRINGRRWHQGGDCARWHEHLVDIVTEADADVIVFSSGVFEMGERQFAGDWYHLGDPIVDRWLGEQFDEIADVLASAGVPVVWATHPYIRMKDPHDPTVPWADMGENDPARVDRLNEIAGDVVADRPGFHVVDLQAWSRDLPGGQFAPEMTDGVHYTGQAARLLSGSLTPRVLAAAAGDPVRAPQS